jgi:WhiB family redox-sensing transcriptional regulator
VNASTHWRLRAACRDTDPEIHFPEPVTRLDLVAEAKRICRGCDDDVKAECLQFALDRDIRFGVWGGKTPAERGQQHHAPHTPRKPQRLPTAIRRATTAVAA